MVLDTCRLCGCELEEMHYGHPINKDNHPYGLSICYSCLERLKKYILGKE